MENSNLLYDRISNLYDDYIKYNSFLEEKKEALKKQTGEIAKMALESIDNPDIEKFLFSLHIEQKVYANDVQLLFSDLCSSVDAYTTLEGVMILPDNITKLCKDYAHFRPRTLFVIKKDGKVEERERGTMEKIKDFNIKTGSLKLLAEQLTKNIEANE